MQWYCGHNQMGGITLVLFDGCNVTHGVACSHTKHIDTYVDLGTLVDTHMDLHTHKHYQ